MLPPPLATLPAAIGPWLDLAGLAVVPAAVTAASAGFALRAAAIRWKLALPAYGERR